MQRLQTLVYSSGCAVGFAMGIVREGLNAVDEPQDILNDRLNLGLAKGSISGFGKHGQQLGFNLAFVVIVKPAVNTIAILLLQPLVCHAGYSRVITV